MIETPKALNRLILSLIIGYHLLAVARMLGGTGYLPEGRFLYIFQAARVRLASHSLFLAVACSLAFRNLLSRESSRLWMDTVSGLFYMLILSLANGVLPPDSPIFIYNYLSCLFLILLGYGAPSLYIITGVIVMTAVVQDSRQYGGERLPALLVIGLSALAHVSLVNHFKKENADLERRLAKSNWAATEFVKANAKLQYDAALGREKGRLSERVRLAREIHDSVGHSLTAMLMQIRMVSKIAAKSAQTPPELSQELAELERTTSQTLNDVRREVSSLREEGNVVLSWQVRWKDLCRKFADATGTQLLLSVPDRNMAIPDDLGAGVFRILQESLTNAIRHGRAGTIDITMQFRDDREELYLRISDDGTGTDKISPGNGLTGIRERADALGGEVAWQSALQKGFDIGIRLPLKEKELWKQSK